MKIRKSLLRNVLAALGIAAALATAGCGTEGDVPTERVAGMIRGTVGYFGAATGEVQVAAFSSFPPRGAPLASVRLHPDEYPASYELGPLPDGRYFVLALIDVDPDDGDHFHPARDPGGAFGSYLAPTSVGVSTAGAADVDVVLEDPQPDSPWLRRNYR